MTDLRDRDQQRRPWSIAALDLLADRKWHDREDLVQVIVAKIPPGTAYRYGEHVRNGPDCRPNGPGPRTRGSRDDSIRTGARRIATRVLGELRRRGHVETNSTRTRYRLTPKAR